MRLASIFLQEAPVKVFDKVGTTPIQLRCDGGHERGHESCEQDSQERMRCLPRRHQHVSALGLCRSEEHTSELQSQSNLVCRLLLEKKKTKLNHISKYDTSY